MRIFARFASIALLGFSVAHAQPASEWRAG